MRPARHSARQPTTPLPARRGRADGFPAPSANAASGWPLRSTPSVRSAASPTCTHLVSRRLGRPTGRARPVEGALVRRPHRLLRIACLPQRPALPCRNRAPSPRCFQRCRTRSHRTLHTITSRRSNKPPLARGLHRDTATLTRAQLGIGGQDTRQNSVKHCLCHAVPVRDTPVSGRCSYFATRIDISWQGCRGEARQRGSSEQHGQRRRARPAPNFHSVVC